MGEELAFNAGDTEDVVSIPGQEDALEKETIPVFLPGKSRGQKDLAGYSPQRVARGWR